VAGRTLLRRLCSQIVRQRRQSHWFSRYEQPYDRHRHRRAVHRAGEQGWPGRAVAGGGVRQYAEVWFRVDQLYRQFIYHMRAAGQSTLLAAFRSRSRTSTATISCCRSTTAGSTGGCQQPLGGAAGQAADQLLHDFVRPFLRKGNKVVVVISDALRYEIGEELLHMVRQEDRYDAASHGAGVLPSYTNWAWPRCCRIPRWRSSSTRSVLADGASTQGTRTARRSWNRRCRGGRTALKAEDLLNLGSDDSRASCAIRRDLRLSQPHRRRRRQARHRGAGL
jgi:hypothetical protein